MGDDIKNLMNHLAQQKGVSLEAIISDTIQKLLLLDDLKIKQILLNLVGNSIKFTCCGCVVSFDTYPSRGDKDIILEGILDLHIQIKDTGKGISNDQQEVVFDVFEQEHVASQTDTPPVLNTFVVTP